MDQGSYFAGDTHWGRSEDANALSPVLGNEFLLIPHELLQVAAAPLNVVPVEYSTPGPVIITSYEIYQTSTGTGICLLFIDAATLPVDGTAFTEISGLRFIAPLTPTTNSGKAFIYNPSGPGHRYNTGFGVICSTSDAQVTRANEQTLFAVNYMAYRVG